MNRRIKSVFLAAAAVTAMVSTSCNSGKSYAELLTEENHAVNYFLANERVVGQIPEDSIFETGPDAPYYRINEDGNLYMQVINPGNPKDRVSYDELIYFRFTRYNLASYMETGDLNSASAGNSNNLLYGATSFRYQNTYLTSTASYGIGIQEPLKFLGVGCEVNIVIKSQLGPSQEIAQVTPFLYNIRYFRSPL